MQAKCRFTFILVQLLRQRHASIVEQVQQSNSLVKRPLCVFYRWQTLPEQVGLMVQTLTQRHRELIIRLFDTSLDLSSKRDEAIRIEHCFCVDDWRRRYTLITAAFSSATDRFIDVFIASQNGINNEPYMPDKIEHWVVDAL